MYEDIKQKSVEFFHFHSPAAKDLLSRLLVKDPNLRLSDPEEIMAHEFFANIDWDRMIQRNIATPYTPVLQDPTDPAHFDVT